MAEMWIYKNISSPLCEYIDLMKWRTDLKSMPLSTSHQKQSKCRKIGRRISNTLKIYDEATNENQNV